MTPWKKYRVHLIHVVHDWDAEFEFLAESEAQAKEFALAKLANKEKWVVSSVETLG